MNRSGTFVAWLIFVGLSVLVLCVVLAWQEDASRFEAEHAKRQQRHDLQLRACLNAGGVPYFHEAGGRTGLFARCDLPLHAPKEPQ